MTDAVQTSSLDKIGLEHGIDQASSAHGYLDLYEDVLTEMPILQRIVVVGATRPVAVANTLSEFVPNAKVLLLRLRMDVNDEMPRPAVNCVDVATIKDMHTALAGFGPIDFLLEDGTHSKVQKRDLLLRLFFHLREGGIYAVEDLHTLHLARFNTGDGVNVLEEIVRSWNRRLNPSVILETDNGCESAFSNALGSVRLIDKLALLEKAGDHRYKMRFDDVSPLVYETKLKTISNGSFAARSRLVTNNPDLARLRFKSTIEYPMGHVHAYRNVTCAPGQIYSQGNVILPDSFRRYSVPVLNNRHLKNVSNDFVLAPSSKAMFLTGTYFALDNEFFGHFGHVTSESVSKLWGWTDAKNRYPELRVLISRPSGKGLAEWEYALLQAAGISTEEVRIVAEPVRVERLVSASPLFHQPSIVNPMIKETWDEIGAALDTGGSNYPKKMFVGRKSGASLRACRNGKELEAQFRESGFAVVYPEDYSLAEQVSMFRAATSIAGYAGSGLFNLMFAGAPKDVVVIGSESYDATNEYLISSVIGGSLTYFWCAPEISQPAVGWSEKAFHSDYSFDFQKDGELLTSRIT